jgi:hypothetical protein
LIAPAILSPCEQLLDCSHGEEETTVMAFGREELEPVVLVEGLCIIVLGVGDESGASPQTSAASDNGSKGRGFPLSRE